MEGVLTLSITDVVIGMWNVTSLVRREGVWRGNLYISSGLGAHRDPRGEAGKWRMPGVPAYPKSSWLSLDKREKTDG